MKTKNYLKKALESKAFAAMFLVFFALLIIYLFTKISFVFNPIKGFFSIMGFPFVATLILYYMSRPIMVFFQKKDFSKTTSTWLTILVDSLVIILLFIWLLPMLWSQLSQLIKEFPAYWNSLVHSIETFLQSDQFTGIAAQFDIEEIIQKISATISQRAGDIVNTTVSGLGSTIGVIVTIGLGLVTAPVLLYYLLKEDEKVAPQILKFFPTSKRPIIARYLGDINNQLSLYIRGQLTVAMAVAIMFSIGYTVIGLPYGVALGILSGFLNIIPYLGSFLAMVPAIIIGIVHSPFMLVKVLIVALIEQTLEGRIISPKILGNNLKIHPALILVVLLTAGKLYGVTGVIIGVPVFAIIRVTFNYIFAYFKEKTNLYPEEEPDDVLAVNEVEKLD
ncbi:MAG: AI-2E family transporter [Erysipelothrix sp.]|nr:AI-2E family transporter [Erysipelothrix sp.]